MNLKIVPLVLALTSLTACAQTPSAAPSAATRSSLASPRHPALTEQVLYQMLLGEIAGQRGDLKLASEAYADLAEKTRDARVAKRGAEIATFAGEAEQARVLAELWVELEPTSAKARQTLISILVNGDRLSEARPHIEALLKQEEARAAEGFKRLHTLLYRSKDKKAVLDLVNELAAGYPLLPEARLAVAQAAWSAGQGGTALKAIDEALELRPGWETAALFRGQVIQMEGDGAILAYWEDFLMKYPHAKEVRLAYAKALARAGKYAEAKTAFERLLADMPGNPDTYLAIGLLALQMNDPETAETSLKSALAQGYRDAGQVKLYLGQVEESRKRHEVALQWYRDVEPGPHFLDATMRSALVLGRLGRIPEARALLAGLASASQEEAIEILQADAQLLRDAQLHQDAFDGLSRGLEKYPSSPELLYDRAMAAEKVGRFDVMEADLRRLIVLQPNHAHAYNALGYTLADRSERIGEAIDLIRQAHKLAPDDPFILDSMGWVLFRGKQLGEAETYLRRAYSARPDPEIAAHLGEVLWVKGDRAEAGRVWQGALKQHPDNEILRETLSRLRP
jgi:tetratricopeptide (TPR) repeat protein